MKRPFPFHSNAVWPSHLMVGVFIVVCGLLECGLWLIQAAVANNMDVITDMPEIRNIRLAILTGAAGVYAVYRLWRFHPACNQPYAAWLKLSPWTADKPLPLGPIHVVWQDAVVIGALTAIAVWYARLDPALPAAVFGLVYLCGLTLLLALTRRWWSCLALGFLWPALILPSMEGAPSIALVAAIIAVIWRGHRASLKIFPWEFLTASIRSTGSLLQMDIRIDGLSGSPTTTTSPNVGWPFLALSPKFQCHSISTRTSFCISALIGWWSLCAIERFEIQPLPEFILFLAVLAAAARLMIYCSGIAIPFGVGGRIASRRIIVPGFDRVFVTPLVVVLVAICGGMIVRRSGSWYPMAESCVIALIWHVLLSGGPTLRNWLLTGHFRFRIPVRNNASKQLLRPI